jgi:hypothetical protein
MICNSTERVRSSPDLSSITLILLARHNQLPQIIERHVAAAACVVQAAIRVFSYEAFLLHRSDPKCLRHRKRSYRIAQLNNNQSVIAAFCFDTISA